MSVKHRRELVGFKNSDDEFDVDMEGVIGGGKHIKPHEVNELVEKYGDDVVFFDGRNEHEARIGKFKNAVVPDTRTSRDFIKELESDKYDHLKNKKVISYCTGGIRCEKTAAWMQAQGLKVAQLDGGILNFFELMPDAAADWQGECYVFDKRIAIDPTHQQPTGTTAEDVFTDPADHWRLARARRLDP
jgi:UPF0176 protein